MDVHVIDALACARLARLVTADTILDPVRDRFLARWPNEGHVDIDGTYAPAHKLGELVVCPWCVSVWLAGGIVAARRYLPGVWGPVAVGLALSEVAGLAATMTS